MAATSTVPINTFDQNPLPSDGAWLSAVLPPSAGNCGGALSALGGGDSGKYS